MNCGIRHLACIFIIAAASLASGCATVVKGSTQTLTVQTDPDGARCELMREGQTIGAVNPTPGTVQVDKDMDDIEVTCRKKGFTDAQATVSSTVQGWTAGNILIGGLIGFAIDAGSGAMSQYPPEIALKLTPDKFTTAEERDAFFENWRAEVLQNSTKAKIAASKTCSKEQCDDIVNKIDRETEQALAGIEANRTLRASTQSPTSTAPGTAQPVQDAQGTTVTTARIDEGVPVSSATQQAAASEAARPTWMPVVGDRWIYSVTTDRRNIGRMIVETVGVAPGQVTERITRPDVASFNAERVVTLGLDSRQMTTQTLPGGYVLAELHPYLAGQELKIGDSWNSLHGTFFIPHIKNRQHLMNARVVARETIKVAGGEFDGWRIEAASTGDVALDGKIKCTWWLSPSMKRVVKIRVKVESPYTGGQSDDVYDLVAFEPAR